MHFGHTHWGYFTQLALLRKRLSQLIISTLVGGIVMPQGEHVYTCETIRVVCTENILHPASAWRVLQKRVLYTSACRIQP